MGRAKRYDGTKDVAVAYCRIGQIKKIVLTATRKNVFRTTSFKH